MPCLRMTGRRRRSPKRPARPRRSPFLLLCPSRKRRSRPRVRSYPWHVQALAKAVRGEQAALVHTYSLALGIIFLDKLGGADLPAADREVIQSLALRLVAGQTSMGAWSYRCPLLSGSEERKLADYLR